jgi:pilus assembly protein CpaB
MTSPSRSSGKVSAAKFGAIGFMAVALGCAALAAFLVSDLMRSKYTGSRVVPTVVAASDLKAGTPISAEDLIVKDWPEEAAPKGSFATVEEVLAAGTIPTVGILAGEPVVSSRLSNNTSGTGVASLIRTGMRAVSLQVEDAVGFTGLVYPGAYVDVIATIRDPMGRGPSSRIAVQNAKVLSLGMDADVATRSIRKQKADRLTGTPEQGGTYVTIEVTPAEAEVLAIARNEGTLDLALRNATDDQVVETTGAIPTSFSAFAPDVIAENLPQELLPENQSGKDQGKKKKRRGVRVKRQNRRVQIVASDEPDTEPTAPPKIETYNAN